MVVKLLISNKLVLKYEYLADTGMLQKKSQSFTVMPLQATDDDMYEIGSDIGNMLKSSPKSIEQNTTFLLTEG